MSIKAVSWILASALCLSACSGDKTVVIQPGTFTQAWPTALRAELLNHKLCAVDLVNGKTPQGTLTFKSGETLSMVGWIFSRKDGAPPAVHVQLVGPALTYTAVAQKRTVRPDVNRYLKVDSNKKTGFVLHASQNAKPGEYHVQVLQPGKHGVAQCDTPVIIKIDPR